MSAIEVTDVRDWLRLGLRLEHKADREVIRDRLLDRGEVTKACLVGDHDNLKKAIATEAWPVSWLEALWGYTWTKLDWTARTTILDVIAHRGHLATQVLVRASSTGRRRTCLVIDGRPLAAWLYSDEAAREQAYRMILEWAEREGGAQ